MPQRNSRFRSGDVAESLGTVLLQGAALVAPVPRSEDVGLDVVATLLKKEDSYSAIATNSFYVQLKSSSQRVVKFETERAVNWLLSLELPFFIGSVDISQSRINLFACHQLTQAIIEGIQYQSVLIDLDGQNECDGPKDGRKLCVGPAVHSWSVSDMADSTFVERTYSILQPHLKTARRNLELGRCGRYERLEWKTSEPPELAGIKQMTHTNSIRSTLDLAMPYISACMLECIGGGADDAFEAFYGVVQQMHQLGADEDPLIDKLMGMKKR